MDNTIRNAASITKAGVEATKGAIMLLENACILLSKQTEIEKVALKDCAFIDCPSGMRSDLINRLDEAGIKTAIKEAEYGAKIFFRKDDMAHAKIVQDKFIQERKHLQVLTFDDFATRNKGLNVVKYEGVTAVELEALKDFVLKAKYAQAPVPEGMRAPKQLTREYENLNQNYIAFNYSYKRDGDNFTLYTDSVNQKEMQIALFHATTMARNPDYNKRTQAIVNERELILNKALKGEEFYLSSNDHSDRILHFNKNGMEVIQLNQVSDGFIPERIGFVARGSIDFKDCVCDELAHTYRTPVMMSKDEILEPNGKIKKKTKDIMKDKAKSTYPIISKESYEYLQKLQKNLQIIERKMALDNPESGKFINSIYNCDEVDIGAFEERENGNERQGESVHKIKTARDAYYEIKTDIESGRESLKAKVIETTQISEKELSLSSVTNELTGIDYSKDAKEEKEAEISY